MDIVDRRQIITCEPGIPGIKQPYHYAAKLGLTEAQQYLENCAAVSERLAVAAVSEVIRDLHSRHFRVVGSAILWALGRPLPPLPKILASHALIHTAEGEFFRKAILDACEHLRIAVVRLPERELEERAEARFGKAAPRLERRISSLGRSLGPPWTRDQKAAALAAAIALAE